MGQEKRHMQHGNTRTIMAWSHETGAACANLGRPDRSAGPPQSAVLGTLVLKYCGVETSKRGKVRELRLLYGKQSGTVWRRVRSSGGKSMHMLSCMVSSAALRVQLSVRQLPSADRMHRAASRLSVMRDCNGWLNIVRLHFQRCDEAFRLEAAADDLGIVKPSSFAQVCWKEQYSNSRQ